MARDHHLRERRLKLGVSQGFLGIVAGFRAHVAQTTVSNIERGKYQDRGQKVRRALNFLESRKRVEREQRRKEIRDARFIEKVIVSGCEYPGYDDILIDYMAELLCDGRAEEFDFVATTVPDDITLRAGEKYLELS